MTSVPRERGPGAMGSLRWALSWLMVGAVGLAPILAYWVVRLIGRAFRSKRGGRGTGSRLAENEGGSRRNGATRPGQG
jgi:hypothetical protein